jgi:predicted AlkP superfamily phosphohydrolase/phosphomutase
LPGFDPRELAMDVKLEERATEGCSKADEYAPWIELHIRRERNWLRVLRHLAETDPCELTAVVFDGVDKLQHLCWRFIDCEPDTEWQTDWERRAHQLCMQYFAELDAAIAELCSFADSATTVVIASDHGFGPTAQVFHLNTWLEQHGYLAWAPDAQQRHGSEDAVLGVNHVARHTFLMDWSRTRAFATTPTSNGIYIARRSQGGAGVSDAEYELFRERLIEELRQFRDPATGDRVVRRIWTREEAFAGPFMSMAPDLTLGLADGGLISILPSDDVLTPRPHTSGTHRPVGIFIARGPGMHRNGQVDEMSILDVAPIVLHSLDLLVPEALEGRVPEDIYEPAAMRARPVKIGAAGQPEPDRFADFAPSLDPEEEAIVMQRLQELGYIE